VRIDVQQGSSSSSDPSSSPGILRKLFDRKSQSHPDVLFLQKCYCRDDNAVPAEYILMPRIGENTEFTAWENTEKILHRILSAAAENISLSDHQCLKYTASAMHQEIFSGALNPPDTSSNPAEHVFAFMRTINGRPDDITAKDYVDWAGDHTDESAAGKLNKLKEQVRN
jgi:hypothetical protein